jgi:hypothetical protein
MRRRTLGLAAVVLALSAAPAVAAPTVTVRVEGQNATLLPPTTVTLGPDPVQLSDGPCPGNSAAAALDKATGGNWSRASFATTILGETHAFPNPDYWAEWVSNRYGNGLCSDLLNEGDEVLMLVDVFTTAPTVFPLALSGVPATVAPGASFTVSVTQYRTDGNPGTGTPEPAAGVSVGGATTGADGRATLSLTGSGAQSLRAVRGNARSAPVSVCVTDGSDGACGTTTQSPTACATTGDDGNCGTKDRRAPRGKILSIRDGQRFKKGKGPRGLSGSVTADPSGIADIRLRLTRNYRTHCSTYDARRERLAPMKRCGAKRGKWFSVGDREQWSYLLPSRLGPGRYVLDVQARDRAGNADTLLQRTRTRVVFTVS